MPDPTSEEELFHELSFYTLAHPDPAFIHQHIVDAYAAQRADQSTKPIKVAFALIGLYLHLEAGYSGKAVQQAHMRLAKQRKQWPAFPLPDARGAVTVATVVATPAGPERDQAIERWCRSVWEAWSGSREQVRELLQAELR
jgi:hypothetical protein